MVACLYRFSASRKPPKIHLITSAPFRVWNLFVLLVLISLPALRERTAPVQLMYALPMLRVLAIRSTSILIRAAKRHRSAALKRRSGAI